MHKPFGPTLNVTFFWNRPWLSLGPGWAALAGALAAGIPGVNASTFSFLLLLWLLADPLLGTVWQLFVNQGLWRQIVHAKLPQPPGQGFLVPYAQPGSVAGRVVVRVRQYQRWLHEDPTGIRTQLITVLLAALLALLAGLYLHPAVFWLVFLAIGLSWVAGFRPYNLAATGGGRLQSVVEFLLPWSMGLILWQQPSLLGVLVGIPFWVVYLGGLRMLGDHHRADWLYFGGQLVVVLLLLGFHHLTAAAIVLVLLLVQSIVYHSFQQPQLFLSHVQRYMVFEIVVAALTIGWAV